MLVAEKHRNSGWRAKLYLGFRPTPLRTVLAERFREGPLAVQRAFYPEGDLCHIYLLHPPGGVAGGDSLNIKIDLAEGSFALITTPGATKFYRTIEPVASLQQTLNVTAASLEWMPQENILFPGAKVELSTTVQLHDNATFIGWEINCLGRPVNDERFSHGSAIFTFSLLRDGLPVLHERQLIETEKDLSSVAGLRGNAVFGTLYATTDDAHLLNLIRQQFNDEYNQVLGITLVDGLLIARYLGNSTETARKLFITIWKLLRPEVLNRPACEPRIWNT